MNAYRTQHGRPPSRAPCRPRPSNAPCSNGNGCTGGWAGARCPAPTAPTAVKKILQFGKLLSPMKSFGVGWAYDPGSKAYFFAIVRND